VPGVVEYTVADLMCVCIARQVRDGEVLAQGLATPLVAAGYLLAWRTHAPNVYFASAIGQSVCREGAPLGLARVEELWLARALRGYGFVGAVADMLPSVRPKEYFRPAQVDAHGNFNSVAIGRDPRRPRLRLPGGGGISDVTTIFGDVHLYVPRHSPVVFVEELDFRSGLGHSPWRRKGRGPQYLVSDLGEFDFANGRLRLTRLHPGVDLDDVRRKTRCPLEVSDSVETTPPPTARELEVLRQEVDPLGIRGLEFVSGGRRRRALEELLAQERRRPG
jgi:acyl CoA:acetate/3-ketoacid CoA transferase beta subunit